MLKFKCHKAVDFTRNSIRLAVSVVLQENFRFFIEMFSVVNATYFHWEGEYFLFVLCEPGPVLSRNLLVEFFRISWE